MTSIEALLSAKKELEIAFKKDMEAIEYLLSRLGRTVETLDQPRGRQLDRSAKNPNAHAKEGSLRDWIEKAFRSNAESEWTAPDIYDWAVQQGGVFQSERVNSIAAFGNALRAMAKESVLGLTIRGSGRRPAHYRWNGEMPEITHKQQEVPEGTS